MDVTLSPLSFALLSCLLSALLGSIAFLFKQCVAAQHEEIKRTADMLAQQNDLTEQAIQIIEGQRRSLRNPSWARTKPSPRRLAQGAWVRGTKAGI